MTRNALSDFCPETAPPDHELPPPAFSLVIPCYNEQQALPEAILELREKLADAPPYELIVVNDGSTDETGRLLAEAQQLIPELVIVTHERNRGYGAALKTGIRTAQSPLIVITDADGTYPNERIADLVALAERYDLVVGSRTGSDAKYSTLRSVPKVFLKAYASWIANRRIPDLNSGLRVFRRDVISQYEHMLSDGFSFTTTSTLAFMTNGYRVHYTPIGYSPRIGKSKIRPIRDTLRFVQLIVRMGMYFAPLRVFTPIILVLGAAFAASLCYDVFVLQNLTDKTLMLLMFSMNATFFALLADMIDKRSRHS